MLAVTSHRYIQVESAAGVAVVTLNRPEKRNALSLDVMRELIAAFEAIGADRSVKVAILRGIGPVFSRRPRPARDARSAASTSTARRSTCACS